MRGTGEQGLLESCPQNGDLPKSPFIHWQRWCHRLAQKLHNYTEIKAVTTAL
jgi:hypothetical protein